jgi:hypothetical protein
MNRCITTRYAGPTNTRGSRIIATAYGKRFTVSWDYAQDVQANHESAAEYAASRMWSGKSARVSALAPNGHDRVHVFVSV